jgi:hypothetical protein
MTARATNAVENCLNCCKVMANGFSGAYLSAASERTNFGHCGGNWSVGLTLGRIGFAYGQ